MFARLGAWCHDRRKLVLGLWAAALVLGLALASTVGGAFREEFNLPASQSRAGFDILEENVGGQGTNATRHHRLPGRAGGRRPCGADGHGGAVR